MEFDGMGCMDAVVVSVVGDGKFRVGVMPHAGACE